jgi:hypothetical protein
VFHAHIDAYTQTLIALTLEWENPGNSAHNKAVEAVFRIQNEKVTF